MSIDTPSTLVMRKHVLAEELIHTLRQLHRELVKFYAGREATSFVYVDVIDPNPPQKKWFKRLFSPMVEQSTKSIKCWMVNEIPYRGRFIQLYIDAETGEAYASQQLVMPTREPMKLGVSELMDLTPDDLLDLLVPIRQDTEAFVAVLTTMK